MKVYTPQHTLLTKLVMTKLSLVTFLLSIVGLVAAQAQLWGQCGGMLL